MALGSAQVTTAGLTASIRMRADADVAQIKESRMQLLLWLVRDPRL
jgi:hypothetical protein